MKNLSIPLALLTIQKRVSSKTSHGFSRYTATPSYSKQSHDYKDFAETSATSWRQTGQTKTETLNVFFTKATTMLTLDETFNDLLKLAPTNRNSTPVTTVTIPYIEGTPSHGSYSPTTFVQPTVSFQ